MVSTLEDASEDTFISHSWSCPAWMKYLGICYYLNLDLAVEASTLACVLAVSMLLFRSSGSITVVAQEGQFLLMGALILFPVAMFLLIFFFGQFFCQQSFWFDRICVNQAHSAEKAKTLQGIPAFVAHSQQMLVLLDSTYFERSSECRSSVWDSHDILRRLVLSTELPLVKPSCSLLCKFNWAIDTVCVCSHIDSFPRRNLQNAYASLQKKVRS